MKLFCYHAFWSEKPPSDEYVKMCSAAVSSINGLPLALEVFGSQFFDLKTEKEWTGMLKRLKESQHKEIFERLKLSCDSLDENEKQRMRMEWEVKRWDIPFEVDDAKHFWEECRFHPEHAINILRHKSLIKINKCKVDYSPLGPKIGRLCFEMHDQIRDMGRKVVEDKEKEEKSSSRLWNNPKVVKTLRKQMVFENLKILNVNGDPMDVTPSFSYLPCLEKLMLTNCKELIEVHESIGSLKKLQFLKISGCTMLARLSNNICELRFLKSLDLKGCVNLSSLLEQLVNHMELLEELCLDQTGIESLPEALMAKLPTSLWSLSIKNCQSLKTIPESPISSLFEGMSNNDFFELKSTRSMRASTSWEFMDALPVSCCESVLKLYFTNERIEKLTDSIGQFEHMLTEVHDSVGTLENLKSLWIKGCNAFEGLPHTICHLTSLEWLELSQHFDLSSSPKKLSDMELLKNLGLHETGIKSILTSIEN
ncbi:TMV resistance protein [Nymphaea thermarum]|nr:TMV resistance protein [Nymphaea thermarum]